ncbi:MAG: hypothetical protein ACR65R_11490 [Methylomicrobium sp.]
MMTPENYMYRIFGLRDELNGLVYPITGIERVFESMTLNQPKFSPAELGFIRSISWLYGFYYEAGKIGVSFLLKYLEVYQLECNGYHAEHYKIVRNLRTFLVHNLDLEAIHDKQVVQTCQIWFRQGCGTSFPSEEEHWQPLLIHLLGEAVAFLEVLTDCVRKIEGDENRDMICGQWAQRIRRYYPPHLFDEIIPEVLQDIGRTEMDAIRLRKKYYSDWARVLEIYDAEFDFKTEARKLIEDAALSENKSIPPVTGKDIIEYFDIAPGPLVGDLLEQAKQLYIVERCDKPTLLERLREKKSLEEEHTL